MPKVSGACIELAVSPLDIQEYLQTYSRQQHWVMTADQLHEDSWTFSLEIGKEELLRDTVAESNPKRIDWKRGTVRVNINTIQLTEGFSRTTIRALFRGFGRNLDGFAADKEYWELESSNAFEGSIVSALRSRFSPPPPEKITSPPAAPDSESNPPLPPNL